MSFINLYCIPPSEYCTTRLETSLSYSCIQKGNRKEASNYRPVSLTCICCKILEHIIHTNIVTHLESNNVLSNREFGFCKHHLPELQLIQASHNFALRLHNKSQTDAILMDFIVRHFTPTSHFETTMLRCKRSYT